MSLEDLPDSGGPTMQLTDAEFDPDNIPVIVDGVDTGCRVVTVPCPDEPPPCTWKHREHRCPAGLA